MSRLILSTEYNQFLFLQDLVLIALAAVCIIEWAALELVAQIALA